MRHAGDRLPARLGSRVIDDGVTGFVVDNEDEAIAAIERIGELDRRRVRARFEQRFTAREWPRTISVTTRVFCSARRSRYRSGCNTLRLEDGTPQR